MTEMINDVTNYKPIRKGIIFKFLQDIEGGTFNNTTEWGLEVRNRNEDIKTPRWGIVECVGSEVPTRIKKGSYILIEQLMWTEGFKINEVKHWSTSFEKVIASSNIEPKGLF